jgi:uncharacterized protein YrrD
MLHLARKIKGATVRGIDDELGTLADFYFEESRWAIRYLIVDTGTWLNRRYVPISPMAVRGSWSRAEIQVHITRDQVRNSPEIDLAALERESEGRILNHYRHPHYWDSTGVWGVFDTPSALDSTVTPPAGDPTPIAGNGSYRDDAGHTRTTSEVLVSREIERLRSTNESTGYHIHATDGEIGHVDDFLIGDNSWCVRYLLVDTSNWLGGKSVVVSTEAVRQVDRENGILRVDVSRESIRSSPSFDSIAPSLSPVETGPPFAFI